MHCVSKSNVLRKPDVFKKFFMSSSGRKFKCISTNHFKGGDTKIESGPNSPAAGSDGAERDLHNSGENGHLCNSKHKLKP